MCIYIGERAGISWINSLRRGHRRNWRFDQAYIRRHDGRRSSVRPHRLSVPETVGQVLLTCIKGNIRKNQFLGSLKPHHKQWLFRGTTTLTTAQYCIYITKTLCPHTSFCMSYDDTQPKNYEQRVIGEYL